ncbi:MAG: hypothetical protein S4CHLAM7_05590 [Chlamydiae bacterium]|nr:hypothetical protein [Chlamydiota bacterium]
MTTFETRVKAFTNFYSRAAQEYEPSCAEDISKKEFQTLAAYASRLTEHALSDQPLTKLTAESLDDIKAPFDKTFQLLKDPFRSRKKDLEQIIYEIYGTTLVIEDKKKDPLNNKGPFCNNCKIFDVQAERLRESLLVDNNGNPSKYMPIRKLLSDKESLYSLVALRYLIEQREDSEATETLIAASSSGNLAAIELALKMNADINGTTSNQKLPPLATAAQSQSLAAIERLLQVDEIDVNLNFPLCRATANIDPCPKTIKLLAQDSRTKLELQYKRNPLTSEIKETALSFATHPFIKDKTIDPTESLRVLIDLDRIDLNMTNSDGSTALLKAIHQNNPEAAELLCKAKSFNVNLADHGGISPLFLALHHDSSKFLGYLVSREDLDINRLDLDRHFHFSDDIRSKKSALMLAIEMRKEEHAHFILSHPKLDVNYRTEEKSTLDFADSRPKTSELIQQHPNFKSI